MNPSRLTLPLSTALALCSLGGARAAPSDKAIPVTLDNFVRAESDLYFSGLVKDGGFGKFMHRREPTAVAKQTVIRMNRDTLYSAAVFDLDAGPVTIALPDPDKRFMSMQLIDEDEYSQEVAYGAVVRTLTREEIGTRYVLVAVRILVDPNDPKDVEAVRALQDAIKVSQPGGPGAFKIPDWDASSQSKVRRALLELASTLSRDTKRCVVRLWRGSGLRMRRSRRRTPDKSREPAIRLGVGNRRLRSSHVLSAICASGGEAYRSICVRPAPPIRPLVNTTAQKRRESYEDRSARISILAGGSSSRPDTLKQTGSAANLDKTPCERGGPYVGIRLCGRI